MNWPWSMKYHFQSAQLVEVLNRALDRFSPPARLDASQTADILGFEKDDLALISRAGLLVPLGNPTSFDAEALVASVEAMADHVRGERKLTLRRRTLLPSPVKPLAAQDVLEIRQRLNFSQAVFASLLNVSRVTAISWEKGRRRPSGAALRLLELARRRPEVFQEF